MYTTLQLHWVRHSGLDAANINLKHFKGFLSQFFQEGNLLFYLVVPPKGINKVRLTLFVFYRSVLPLFLSLSWASTCFTQCSCLIMVLIVLFVNVFNNVCLDTCLKKKKKSWIMWVLIYKCLGMFLYIATTADLKHQTKVRLIKIDLEHIVWHIICVTVPEGFWR